MKRGAFIFGLAAAIALSYGFAQSRQTNRTGDVITQTRDAEDNVVAVVALNSLSSATSVVLVDLSDNSFFRHTANRGSIDVSRIETMFDTTDGATSTIDFGVIASTTPSGSLSSVKYFHRARFSLTPNSISGVQKDVFDPSPSILKTRVVSASTVNFVTNITDENSTAFVTTTKYMSSHGVDTTYPGVGDLVARVRTMAGTATFTISVIYRTEE